MMKPALAIQLPQFEGPLDLLLYLIRKEEMDILNIEIHKITEQYLGFLRQWKEMDLEVAGEFVAMAATLLQIKSKMLLPTYDELGEVVEDADPRRDLVQRLLEYQKYQDAAKALYERSLLGRDVWARGRAGRLELVADNSALEVEENAVYSLISALRSVLRSVGRKAHEVAEKIQSVASRILEIRGRLILGEKVALSTLIDDQSDRRSRQLLVTYLSSLELAKLGSVSLYQTQAFDEIWLELIRNIDQDVVSRVEEYENLQKDASPAGMRLPAQTEEEENVQIKTTKVGNSGEELNSGSSQRELNFSDSDSGTPSDGGVSLLVLDDPGIKSGGESNGFELAKFAFANESGELGDDQSGELADEEFFRGVDEELDAFERESDGLGAELIRGEGDGLSGDESVSGGAGADLRGGGGGDLSPDRERDPELGA